MNRTGLQVMNDIYQLLKDSTLAAVVGGKVYHAGTRPRDSKAEDIVIGYVAGTPEQEVQSVIINVNIFIPDIEPWRNGVTTPNVARLTAIEEAAADWVASLTADKSIYLIRLYDTIHTGEAAGLDQHYVNIPLRLYHWSNNEVTSNNQ